MTDITKAIAEARAARTAAATYQDCDARHYLDEAMEGLLAALDAAQGDETPTVKGDAIDAITLAKNEAYARGLKDGAKQAPPAAVPAGYAMVQLADLAALEATDFGRCGWSVRADLAARRLRDGLLAAALAARKGE